MPGSRIWRRSRKLRAHRDEWMEARHGKSRRSKRGHCYAELSRQSPERESSQSMRAPLDGKPSLDRKEPQWCHVQRRLHSLQPPLANPGPGISERQVLFYVALPEQLHRRQTGLSGRWCHQEPPEARLCRGRALPVHVATRKSHARNWKRPNRVSPACVSWQCRRAGPQPQKSSHMHHLQWSWQRMLACYVGVPHQNPR